MSEPDEDAYGELLRNGMFRNREQGGKPIAGSNADFTYDEDEINDCAMALGLVPAPFE